MSVTRAAALLGATATVLGVFFLARAEGAHAGAGATGALGGALGGAQRAAGTYATAAETVDLVAAGVGGRRATGSPSAAVDPSVAEGGPSSAGASSAPCRDSGPQGTRAVTGAGDGGRRDLGDDALLAAAIARRQGWPEGDARTAELALWFAEDAGRPREVLAELGHVEDVALRAQRYNRAADAARTALADRIGAAAAAALARDVRLLRMDPATGAIRPVDATGAWTER